MTIWALSFLIPLPTRRFANGAQRRAELSGDINSSASDTSSSTEDREVTIEVLVELRNSQVPVEHGERAERIQELWLVI